MVGLTSEAQTLLQQSLLSERQALGPLDRAEALRLLGVMALETSPDTALEYFVASLSRNSGDFRAYQAAVEAAAKTQMNAVLISELRSRLPSKPSVLILEPWATHASDQQVPNPYRFDSEWELVGFDLLDQQALEVGAEVEVALWWRSSDKSSGRHNCIELEPYCVQISRIVNLAPNAGFEWNWSGLDQGVIAGYPFNPYQYDDRVIDSPQWSHVLELTRGLLPSQQTTWALRLETRTEQIRTGRQTLAIPVESNKSYLMSGMVDTSQGGQAALGCFWVGDHVDHVMHPSPDYVAVSIPHAAWSIYAGVLNPVPGASACRITLIDYDFQGAALFDNVMLFAVNSPEPARLLDH